jgi:predicted SnoaL-like aldol condensation-catalyzing enzyme
MFDQLHIHQTMIWLRRAIMTLIGSAAAIGMVSWDKAKSASLQEKRQMEPNGEIEKIYKLWDDALGKKDLEAALALYTEDASIESPLVQHLLKSPRGIVQGKDNLRQFIALVFQTNPPERKRFRTGYFTDGRLVTWEYPRTTPEGDQMDLAEVMEIEHGLIKRHRVYWGWYALNVLNSSASKK